MSPKVQAAEQFLRSIPNPGKVKNLYFDVDYYGPQGSHLQAVLIVALLVACILGIAICITVFNVKQARR